MIKENERKNIVECINDMNDSATVWSMVKLISHILEDNNVTYSQFISIFSLIDHYNQHCIDLAMEDEEFDIEEDGDDWMIESIG